MGKFDPANQLSKHGWTSGGGLGRHEDGIREAVKVKLKFDQTGVGHDLAEQFTYHWWDHAFNKAASNIEVENCEQGVTVKASGESQVSAKRGAVDKKDAKSLLYGRFVKATTLTNGIEEKSSSSDEESSSSDEDKDVGTASKLTDEQLLKVCNGRTAHKGARHGLGLSGKLARIAQQEQIVNCGSGNSSPAELALEDNELDSPAEEKKRKKKKKKEKKKCSGSEVEEIEEASDKKSKKKRKKLSCDEETVEPSPKRKKSKSKVDVEDTEVVAKELKKKKKKNKKNKHNNIEQDAASENMNNDENKDVENCDGRKKKRKKSKKKNCESND